MSFFHELKRRNVLRAAGAYVAISWLVLQVAETLLPAFGLEDAVLRTVLVVLAIGFVPAIAAAWAFELTPSGLVRDENVDRASLASRRMDRRLDRVLFVALALAVAYFAVDKFVLDPARDRDRETAAADAARAENTSSGSDTQPGGPSTLAVLPFTAVGDAEDSRFFAAGVHDDLLTRLAKLASLRVISRTSVMKYQDTTMNIRDIGEALGADAILEGGVQSAGNRIRINAQLIEAATDEHLWAETYDRELTTANIFDVQADISRAIATALQATIDEAGAAEERLVPTDNMAAYRAFHEATAMQRKNSRAVLFPEYQALLRRALELDPEFGRAAAELVGALSFANFGSEQNPEELAEAERLLAKLGEIAPGSGDHLIAQAYFTYYVLKDYDLAYDIITRAQQRAPSDLQLLSLKSWIQRRQGDLAGKLDTNHLQRTLDPGDSVYSWSIVGTLSMLHRYEEALAEARTHSASDPRIQLARLSLEVMKHGDLKRRAAEVTALHAAHGLPPTEVVAEHYIDAREYTTAVGLLDELAEPYAPAEFSHISISSINLLRLEALWLGGQRAALDGVLPGVRADFERYRDEGATALLGEALIALWSGDPAASRRAVARWQIQSLADPAARGGSMPFACRTLGMAGATVEAVDCLRTGLVEPSAIMPFMEFQLPHYDSVRDAPEFRALLAEHGTGRS